MKPHPIIPILFAISSPFFTTPISAQGFQQGDLVVLQVGDGSSALTSAATGVSLVEYDVAGHLRGSLAIPNSTGSPTRLTQAGSSTSEGYLSLSADGAALSVVGYDAAVGTAGIASTTAAAANRVVDRISATGVISRAVSSASLFSGQNIRSGVISGSEAWAVGSAGGVVSLAGGSPGSIYTGLTTLRVANIINGNLMFSSQSGTTTRGVYEFNGLPTSTSTPVQILAADSAAKPVDFAFSADATIAYVSDERTTGGGVQKWTKSGGVWSLGYTLNAGTGRGARGLAVDFSGLNPTVFATTTQNELIRLVDNGSGAVPTVLATAAANVEWRGLDFAPIPEPAETAAMTGAGLVALAAVRHWRKVRKNRIETNSPASASLRGRPGSHPR